MTFPLLDPMTPSSLFSDGVIMMFIAYTLGAFAFIGGIGLTVSSGWLITMASTHPPILTLGVAIVLVRFFGIFRSVARYCERIISRKAVFDRLTSFAGSDLFTFSQPEYFYIVDSELRSCGKRVWLMMWKSAGVSTSHQVAGSFGCACINSWNTFGMVGSS
jgi:hypothetical protein